MRRTHVVTHVITKPARRGRLEWWPVSRACPVGQRPWLALPLSSGLRSNSNKGPRFLSHSVPGRVAGADRGARLARPGRLLTLGSGQLRLSAPVSPQPPALSAQGGTVTPGALVCQAEADWWEAAAPKVSFTGYLQRFGVVLGILELS